MKESRFVLISMHKKISQLSVSKKVFQLVRSCGLKKLLLGAGSTRSGLINSWFFPCYVAEISATYQDEGIQRELMTAEQKVFDQREEN
jgi:hypothetical protein